MNLVFVACEGDEWTADSEIN